MMTFDRQDDEVLPEISTGSDVTPAIRHFRIEKSLLSTVSDVTPAENVSYGLKISISRPELTSYRKLVADLQFSHILKVFHVNGRKIVL